MAAQDYTSVVQQLYVSYFGRPADYYGLQNFTTALAALDTKGELKTFAAVSAAMQADKAGTSALSKLVNSFNNSAESNALYGTDNSQVGIGKFVNAIYQNVLGREADISGYNFWVNAITSGALTKANAAAAITQGALDNTSAQGLLDAQTVKNKVAVATAFTTALDTPTEITSYSGDAAAAAARSLLSGVNNATSVTGYQATIDQTISNLGNVVNGQTFAVTAAVDTLAGTSGNDVFNARNVDADGTAASTLNSFDAIDGGAGKDTLNIYTDATHNTDIGANSSIKNVETVNIYNTVAASPATALADASKFVGATALWQIGAAADVTNLQSTTTAGFRSLSTAAAHGVAVVDAATSASIAIDGVVEGSTFNVTTGTAGKLAAVTLSGNAVDGADAGTAVGATNLNVTVGKDVQTLTVNTSVATNLGVTSQGTKLISTIDASASTGAITYADSDTNVRNITTGTGADVVTFVGETVKDDAATTDTDETKSATVTTGAGNDKITVNATTGTGLISIVAGDGNDTVAITARATATLNVDLGAGNDTFVSTVAIGANDKIDAGAGTDMLALNLVGSANVGAFSNFDAFDATALGHALDVEILAQKNTVTEIVASDDVGAGASLINVGAGVSYRVIGDTDVANALTINQKTAGDLTVTLDIDEAEDAATVATDTDAAVVTNATGVKVVFDSSFADEAADATDNIASMTLTATAAKTITVVSGGAEASNVLNIGNGAAVLTTITVTGDSMLTVNGGTGAVKLATIDASAATGGLHTSLATVIDGGTIKLGSGADLIAITGASTVGGVESIQGFEKTAAVSVSTATGDATAKTAAIADADMLSFSGSVATTTTGNAGGDINAKGVLTFTGSGPSTLAAAAGIADTAAETTGEAVVFEYLGNSYVFVQGGATDTLVQLTGITGVTNLVENGTSDHFFLV